MKEDYISRRDQIISLIKSGESMSKIGMKFNISRQRVHQIIKTKHYKPGTKEWLEYIRNKPVI